MTNILQSYDWIIKDAHEFKGEKQLFSWNTRKLATAITQDLHDIVK